MLGLIAQAGRHPEPPFARFLALILSGAFGGGCFREALERLGDKLRRGRSSYGSGTRDEPRESCPAHRDRLCVYAREMKLRSAKRLP